MILPFVTVTRSRASDNRGAGAPAAIARVPARRAEILTMDGVRASAHTRRPIEIPEVSAHAAGEAARQYGSLP